MPVQEMLFDAIFMEKKSLKNYTHVIFLTNQ